MILIADSGSTKTDWVLINNNKIVLKNTTIGLNPNFIETEYVTAQIKKTQIINYADKINKIYFYGAGCSTTTGQNFIKNALIQTFINSTIIVESDLLGAAISQFGLKKGVIGILGTGSNTGIYKDGKIIENISSLGYILGDEGSGAVIGKTFIKLYLEKKLPKNIESKFMKEFNLNSDDIIAKTYKEAFPNKFLASFMPFIYSNKNNDKIKNMLYNNFEDFFNKTVCKYSNYEKYEVKLIGSVAFYFSAIIEDLCNKNNINLNSISKSPVEGLVIYHSNNN